MSDTPVTAEDWLATICPALYNQGEPVYGKWLFMAMSRMATASQGWGGRREEAMAWLTAYLWASATPAATADASGVAQVAPTGPLTSEKARDVSRSYGNPIPNGSRLSATDQMYLRNEYGIGFLTLRNTVPAFGARIVRV